MRQADPANDDQDVAELSCRSCGEALDTGDVVEGTLADVLGGEAYSRHKDTGEDGPIYDCPECGRATFTDHEGSCANCGYEVETGGSCAICDEPFPLADLLAEPDMTLCSYHKYVMDKDD